MMVEKKQRADGKNQIQVKKHIEFESENLQRDNRIKQKYMMENLGKLAGGIAHEMNTPVQYVGDSLRYCRNATKDLLMIFEVIDQIIDRVESEKLLVDIISNYRTKCKKKDIDFIREELPFALDQAIDGADQVLTLARTIRDFSCLSHRAMVPVDLNHIVERASTICVGEWKDIATIEFELAKNLPKIIGDERALIQAVLNLVVNGAYAIGRRKPEAGKIKVRTKQIGNNVQLTIEDDGIGIPENIKDRIFERYFTTKEYGDGTGQGLAFVHEEVVKRHGGNIEIDSKEGEGTKVIIEFLIDTPKKINEKPM